jgi:methylated-DNA-[protein]-cysteine S-methyltransferase
VGRLGVVAGPRGVIVIGYVRKKTRFPKTARPSDPASRAAHKFLKEYFQRGRSKIRFRLDWTGITPFEKKVYKTLRLIPAGQTMTYAAVARKIKKPGASRAVGSALHKNPFLIYVPCHRVLRSDGGLGGFGPGVWMKKWLLKHEKRRA